MSLRVISWIVGSVKNLAQNTRNQIFVLQGDREPNQRLPGRRRSQIFMDTRMIHDRAPAERNVCDDE